MRGMSTPRQPNDRALWHLTLSMSISVDFSAPSGRPKGKQKRKLVICCSSKTRNRSFICVNCSFSSWVTVPTLPGLKWCRG